MCGGCFTVISWLYVLSVLQYLCFMDVYCKESFYLRCMFCYDNNNRVTNPHVLSIYFIIAD